MSFDGPFTLSVKKFVEKTNGNINLVLRKFSLEALSFVIQMSPVLSGRFKGNWQAQIGSYPTDSLLRTDKSGQITIGQVSAVVQTFTSGSVLYMVNNVSYARALEYGHSKQAPEGMVRVTVAHFNTFLANAVKGLPK